MARTAAGQVSADRGIFACGRMIGAALIVALGPIGDVLPAAAQSAPTRAAQQAPYSYPMPFPPPLPFFAEPGNPVERTHRKHVVRRHPSRRTVVETTSPTQLPESNENQRKLAERKGYKRLSDLVNFPKFFPGLGIIFVRPDKPMGPYLCFDRKDHLVATVYMIPIKDIDDHSTIEASGFNAPVDHVSFYFNPGHPGMDMPHYHFVIWHVSKKEEARVAQ